MKKIIFITLFFIKSVVLSQENTITKYTALNKGKFMVSWGGNRGSFTDSDIQFIGKDYNFTLNNVKAEDKSYGVHIDYINPTRMTIPQTNFKLGYFINDNYLISIGFDHMKYVMIQNQSVTIKGKINLPNSEIGSVHNGDFYNSTKILTPNFLTFEHTDGLNYINAEISRVDDVSRFLKIKNTDVFQINFTEGLGFGFLFPRTDATLLSKKRHDYFNISGYGLSAKVGLNFTFFKYFFIQTEFKGGYINLNNIKATYDSTEKAKQQLWFLQRIITAGGIFRI